jgi:hypothetical protein
MRTMQIDDACQCGRVTFTARIDPGRVMVCHCATAPENPSSVVPGSDGQEAFLPYAPPAAARLG